jgi:hypothetical protein
MAELMAKEEDVVTADLASIPPERSDGPKLVKEQEPETLARATAASEPMPLFTEWGMIDSRSQWCKLQTGFVDEPRQAVDTQTSW